MQNQPFKIRSSSEQVADFLRDRIVSDHIQGNMPGVHALAEELGVHHTTAAEALGQLEREGYLKGAGPGRKRQILITENASVVGFRVGLLIYEPEDICAQYFNELRHCLDQAGHISVMADKSLVELNFEVKRLKRIVRPVKADVWIVIAATRDVQAWFVEQKIPVFALFGYSQTEGVARTGPMKGPQLREIIQRLAQLNHKRIVLLIAEQQQVNHPTSLVHAFLDELKLQGLPSGSYNLPYWKHHKGSLQNCLKASFQVTPPTALIMDDPMLVPAVLQFLNEHKLTIPGDVSLICLDGFPSFKWMDPPIYRLETDIQKSIRHAVRWVDRVAMGKGDSRKHNTKAKLIEGGSIGPARQ
jgi:DNA-binding LacI/PurR family transcriptional regulator